MLSPFSNIEPIDSNESSPRQGPRKIVGFEAPDRQTSTASLQELVLPSDSPVQCCTIHERCTRQSSLGQQLLLHKFESERPTLGKLNLSKSKNRPTRMASSGLNHAVGTLPSAQPMFKPMSDSNDSPFGHQQQSQLQRAFTAPEPIPIPELSPSTSHLFGSRPPSRQVSPPQPAAPVPVPLSRSNSTKLRTTNTPIAARPPTGPVTPSSVARELEVAHATAVAAQLQAQALQEALLQERQEVVRLRQELRRMGLERAASTQLHSYNTTQQVLGSREPSPHAAPMHIDTPQQQHQHVVVAPVPGAGYPNITIRTTSGRLPPTIGSNNNNGGQTTAGLVKQHSSKVSPTDSATSIMGIRPSPRPHPPLSSNGGGGMIQRRSSPGTTTPPSSGRASSGGVNVNVPKLHLEELASATLPTTHQHHHGGIGIGSMEKKESARVLYHHQRQESGEGEEDVAMLVGPVTPAAVVEDRTGSIDHDMVAVEERNSVPLYTPFGNN